MTNHDHPDAAAVHGQPDGPTRYDHRDEAARAADAEEDRVVDAPLEQGAAELREQVTDAERRGELEDDPAAPR
jgi:aspartate/methionine/tyrosine aminotransferase